MLSRVRRLPSPALVISAIALVLAVGGGSFAFALTDNQKDKKIAKKVSNKQITKRAPGLSVKHATSADSANPIAFAQVAKDGTLNATNSKGVVQGNITNPFPGEYCFSGLGFTPRGGQVTPDFNESGLQSGQFGLSSSDCPAGTQAVAFTTNPTANAGFFVMFYR